MNKYDSQRPHRKAPQVSLKGLRVATGQTLDQVAKAVSEVLGRDDDNLISRGTIAAIEGGHRGASEEMLEAIAAAYGLERSDLVTPYEPRQRPTLEPVVNQ